MSHIYMHPDVEAARVRDMLAKWRALEAAQDAYADARKAYLEAQRALTGAFPSNQGIGPYAIGDVLIEDNGSESVSEDRFRFSYRECRRIHTS